MTTHLHNSGSNKQSSQHQQNVEMNDPSLPLKSSELFADTRVRKIEHQGEDYLLRLTRSGKLILCK